MKTIRVGIVGVGKIAQGTHIPILLNIPNVRIEWITDIDIERAQKVAVAYGLRAVKIRESNDLPDCDVALLAIPVGVRTDYYRACSQKGFAVLAEKPFALTMEDHKRFQGMFSPYSIACGYMRRMYGTSRLLREIISKGWFGEPIAIRISEGARMAATDADKPYTDELSVSGGGVLMNFGCHTLDTSLFIADATEFEIIEQSMIMDGQIDRKVNAKFHLFRGPKHKRCLLDYCVSWIDRQRNRIEVEFSNVVVTALLGPSMSVEIRGLDRVGRSATMYLPNLNVSTSVQAFFMEWSEFLHGLEHKTPSLVAAENSALTSEAIDQLYRNGRR